MGNILGTDLDTDTESRLGSSAKVILSSIYEYCKENKKITEYNYIIEKLEELNLLEKIDTIFNLCNNNVDNIYYLLLLVKEDIRETIYLNDKVLIDLWIDAGKIAEQTVHQVSVSV